MTEKPSLAVRVHALIGANAVWTGALTVDEQIAIFGVALSPDTLEAVITTDKSGMPVIDPCDGFGVHTLKSIQSRIETDEEYDRGWEHEDGLTCDYYRTFPRDEAAFVGIENADTGFAEMLIGTTLDEAKDNLACYHGYADWVEMIGLLPSPEAWTAVWTDGDPEENRQRDIARLTAERKELVGKFDAVSRVAEIDELLEMYSRKDRILEPSM